ncbi:glycosyltransferase [Nonlabens ulvanivorans]|uniref:glycosyltransferase n=1 Tax=Nonlabens ulvanivorans TaxID=906888 RepID=UPI0037C70A32
MKKILLFSSLCKPKKVLEQSLPSMIELHHEGVELDVLFYDDNKTNEAQHFVQNTGAQYDHVTIEKDYLQSLSTYKKHNWTVSAVDRIIEIKNRAIQIALENDYDYLFLVDADLVLHPDTLLHLLRQEKDFIFELFWTVFTNDSIAKPNCWDIHSWSYTSAQTILQLKNPGTYKVGAGGACTLLSKKALKKGLDFKRISNLPYGGEDRHICTRAEVLDIDIYIDTHYPAYHIHNPDKNLEAQEWKQNGYKRSFFDSWLDANWEIAVKDSLIPKEAIVPKTKIHKVRLALYKAKRAYYNYMRFN